jgi:hypothetical protein
MKRRRVRERDEAAAREQAESRTEALLAQMKAQQAGALQTADEDTSEAPVEPDHAETAREGTTEAGDG